MGGFIGASRTFTGEVSLGDIFFGIRGFFRDLFSFGGQGNIDKGPPDNDPARIIVVGTPIHTGSVRWRKARGRGDFFGGGLYQGVGPNGFGGLGSGFGGIGGPFEWGIGGQGFGEVRNNSPGVLVNLF